MIKFWFFFLSGRMGTEDSIYNFLYKMYVQGKSLHDNDFLFISFRKIGEHRLRQNSFCSDLLISFVQLPLGYRQYVFVICTWCTGVQLGQLDGHQAVFLSGGSFFCTRGLCLDLFTVYATSLRCIGSVHRAIAILFLLTVFCCGHGKSYTRTRMHRDFFRRVI